MTVAKLCVESTLFPYGIIIDTFLEVLERFQANGGCCHGRTWCVLHASAVRRRSSTYVLAWGHAKVAKYIRFASCCPGCIVQLPCHTQLETGHMRKTRVDLGLLAGVQL